MKNSQQWVASLLKIKNNSSETLPQWAVYTEHMHRVSSRKNIKISLYQKITKTLHNHIYLCAVRKRCISELYGMIGEKKSIETLLFVLCMRNTFIIFWCFQATFRYRLCHVMINFRSNYSINEWLFVLAKGKQKKTATWRLNETFALITEAHSTWIFNE